MKKTKKYINRYRHHHYKLYTYRRGEFVVFLMQKFLSYRINSIYIPSFYVNKKNKTKKV